MKKDLDKGVGPMIKLADGRLIQPTARAKFDIELREYALSVEAVVLNLGAFGLLIGANVLEQLGKVSIDYLSNPPKLCLLTGDFAMKAIQQPEKFPKMRSQQRVTIPALSAKLVSVKWEDESPTSRNEKVVLLEPSKELLEKKD